MKWAIILCMLIAACDVRAQTVEKLKSGVMVELVGISENPSKGKPWWKADGLALDKAPFAELGGTLSKDGELAREIAYRLDLNTKNGPASVELSVNGNPSAVLSGSPMDEQQRLIETIGGIVVTVPPDPQGITLRLDLGTGPWETIFVCTSDRPNSQVQGSKPPQLFMFSTPFEVKGSAHVVFTKSEKPMVAATRLIVMDKSGKMHVGESQSIQAGGLDQVDSEIAEYEFSGVPLKNVKEFRYQKREFNEWIEIRNVCVDPKHPTKPVVVTSDGDAK